MAFTKIVGAGIHTLSNVHTHNINSSGIITATNFVGPFDGTTGDFSGNVTIGGNLVVNGDTTTLNTTLREVELLKVDADSSITAGIITQRGSGDILNLFDNNTEVLTVKDGGKVGIGTVNPSQMLSVYGNIYQRGNDYITWNNGDSQIGGVSGYNFAISTYDGSSEMLERVRITGGSNGGRVGIGSASPGRPLTITDSDPRIRLQDSDTGGHAEIYTDNGHHLYLTADSSASAGGSRIVFQTDGANEKLRIDNTGKVSIAAGGNIGFATDSNTYIEQDALDRISFIVGGLKTVSMIEAGTNYPVLLVDKNGTNTSKDFQGGGYYSNPHANDLVIGNVSSGNHGITICTPSSGHGNINFSDGNQNAGHDSYRGSVGYNHSTEQMIVRAKSGTVVLRNDATDALVASGGKIGIGTALPGAPLHLHDDSPKILLKDTDNDAEVYLHNVGGAAVYSSTGDAVFQTPSTEIIRFATTGNVGIGTVNPTYPLQVHNSSAGGLLRLLSGHEGNYDLRFVYQNNEANIWSYGSTDLTFGTRYAKKLHLVTNGPSKRLTVDDGGNVGIGITNPSVRLHLKLTSRTSDFRITDSDTTADVLRAGAQPDGDGLLQLRTTGGSGPVLFDASGSSYIVGGNFGVGTVSPTRSFHVKGMASGNSTNRMMIIESTGTSGSFLAFQDANTTDDSKVRIGSIGGNNIGIRGDSHSFQDGGGNNKMVIDSSGQITNTGIATSFVTTMFAANFAKLDIRGTNIANSNHYILSYGEGHANDHEFHMVNTLGDLVFRTGSSSPTERVRITSSGKVGINIAGSDNTTPVRNLDIADASGAILRLISTDDSLSANERLGEIEFYTDDDDGGHIGAYLKAISDPSDSFGRRTALTFGVQSAEAQNAIEKMRLTAGGQLFINSTAVVNTNDFLTIKRPAGNHDVTSMTLDATTATGSYANALIFTKAKDYYYNGIIFTSSAGHQGGLCGKMTTNGGSTPQIDLRIGGTSFNQSDTLAMTVNASGNIDMYGYLKAKPSPGNGDNQLAKGRHYQWNATNLSPNASAGLESGWYPIMDISDGQYMFFIETGAHNSATCLVTNGYDPSQVSRINVLNCVRNNNGNYLNIQRIRVLNNGIVEVYLYAGTPTYFGMNIQMISSHSMPNFYTTLTKNTGSPTVDDSKDFYTYSGSVGDGLMHVESLRVDGTISKGTDNFEIPHPLSSKKDTHHLFHSMIEGPQCDNIYRGKVTLSSGAATINLDTVSNMTEGTFVLLNRDVQCFTTNETGWGAVKGSISGNILTISAQDGSSTDTISWMVVGERQDDEVKKSKSTDDDGHLIVERDVSSHDDDLTGDTLS